MMYDDMDDEMAAEPPMTMGEDELGGMEPEPQGVLSEMLAGAMPSPAEMADILGVGSPSFEEVMMGQPVMGFANGGADPSMGMGQMSDPALGTAPYDPEAVKADLKMFLQQKAAERQAASEKYQAKAFEGKTKEPPSGMMGGGMPY